MAELDDDFEPTMTVDRREHRDVRIRPGRKLAGLLVADLRVKACFSRSGDESKDAGMPTLLDHDGFGLPVAIDVSADRFAARMPLGLRRTRRGAEDENHNDPDEETH